MVLESVTLFLVTCMFYFFGGTLEKILHFSENLCFYGFKIIFIFGACNSWLTKLVQAEGQSASLFRHVTNRILKKTKWYV